MSVLINPYRFASTPAFVPTDLGSKLLAWWDPSDLSTMYQGGGTGGTPVSAAGQTCGYIGDKSGNGHNLSQATSALWPTYQVDGGGHSYLLFDGINDALGVAGWAPTLPFDRITAIQQVSWTGGDWIWYGAGATGSAGSVNQYTGGGSPLMRMFDGTSSPIMSVSLAVGTNGVLTERQNATASKFTLNNGSDSVGGAGASNPAQTNLGGTSVGGSASNIRFYGAIIGDGTLTTTEIANCRTYLGNKCGLTL